MKQLREDVNKLNKIVFTGNGNQPLTVTIARQSEQIKVLSEKIQTMSNNFELMNTNISALLKFQIESQTRMDIKEKKIKINYWKIGLLVTGIYTIFKIIIPLIFKS